MKQDPSNFTPGAATDGPASSLNRRARHDGFDAERKLLFLTALRQGASVLDACALVGMSNRTAYNHRRRDPGFAEAWRLARGAHKLPLELVAYQRAVEGVEEQVYRHGKPSHVRTHYSDSLLRLLLAGEQPGKYGRRAALLPDLEWLRDTMVDCIAGETAPLEAARAVALDEIAALKAQLKAPPAPPPANRELHEPPCHSASPGERCRAQRGATPVAAGGRRRQDRAGAPKSAESRGRRELRGQRLAFSLMAGRRARARLRSGVARYVLHTLCTGSTFDTGSLRVYRRGHE